jgi:exopolyphosphatase/guanosine-5'-triphosphate,3'-diphosphate pyrophosphatase
MTDTNSQEIIASVDLGSNSFHMLVARVDDTGNLHPIDKLKEMVRLRGGLDNNNNLSKEAEERALDCLSRFGERIRHLPADRVRIAGTNTLRTMKDAQSFQRKAKKRLGHSIEIIGGREEARLVYLGVAHTLSDDHGKRMVVDIGGGSTEFIIGDEFKPKHLESLNMGSVSVTQRYFPDGSLKKKLWKKANTALRLEIMPIQKQFDQSQWEISTGSSGTIKATRKIILELGLEKFGITLYALHTIRDIMIKAGHFNNLELPGLKSDRAPVYAGGLAVLIAIFESLHIKQMTVSDGALREGLLYDLIGRIHHEDVRDKTSKSLAKRFNIDPLQAEQVKTTALHLFDQVRKKWDLPKTSRAILAWAADLHELGMSIEHNKYHQHGAYILEFAYTPGFSRRDKLWLALLTATHRRKIEPNLFHRLPDKHVSTVQRLCILLRLSVLLHRSRKNESVLPRVKVKENELKLHCTSLSARPMLMADLQREKKWIEPMGYSLSVEIPEDVT